MLSLLVNKVIEENNIKDYKLVNSIYSLEDYSRPLMLNDSICIVYDFSSIGQVSSMNDFSKQSVILNSRQNRVAYAQHCKYNQVGNAIQCTSELVSVHLTRIDVFVPKEFQLFTQLYQSHFKYLLLTPIK